MKTKEQLQTIKQFQQSITLYQSQGRMYRVEREKEKLNNFLKSINENN